jgi:thiosulfate/3-mercaptopyruvate sulfurtransferase
MYTTVVSPEVLSEHLDDSSWVVIDCRHALADFGLGRRLYNEAHIPGAFFADVEHDLAGEKNGFNGRHPLPDASAFASFLESLGVSDGTQIVAYDAGADMFAARLWFLCRWIGHDAVAVLDGGIAAWRAEGFPVTSEPSSALRDGTINVQLRSDLVVYSDYVLSNLASDIMQLVDARASDRYAGENETIDPVAGHIPSARNRWFKANFDESGRFKSPEQLRHEFFEFGVPHAIVHQCGSGVSVAVNMLAMEHAGLSESRLYGGSWSEWVADPSRPVATGDTP